MIKMAPVNDFSRQDSNDQSLESIDCKFQFLFFVKYNSFIFFLAIDSIVNKIIFEKKINKKK